MNVMSGETRFNNQVGGLAIPKPQCQGKEKSSPFSRSFWKWSDGVLQHLAVPGGWIEIIVDAPG